MLVAIFKATFKATLNKPDKQFNEMATQLRQRAKELYGCIDFISVTENDVEIALSYWPDEEHLLKWKKDELHLMAQSLGKTSWYRDYSVQIAEVKKSYGSEKSYDILS